MTKQLIQKSLIVGVSSLVLNFTCVSKQVAAEEVKSTNVDRQEVDRTLKESEVNEARKPAGKFMPKLGKLLEEADQNEDAYLTEKELRQTFQGRFNTLDRDGNLIVNRHDTPNLPFARSRFLEALSRLTSTLDADASGGISFDEFFQGTQDVHHSLDVDADGKVQLVKMKSALQTMHNHTGE